MNRHHDIIIKQTVEVEEVMSAIVESSTLSPAGSSRQLRTGDVLCLQDEVFQHSVHFLLEAVSSSTFLFAKLEQPYQRLHITSKEVVFKTSSPNRDNLLFLEENPANGSVVIRTNNKDKPASTSSISKNYNHPPAIVNNWYLGISHDGELTTIPFTSTVLSTSVETRGMISCCFQVVEVLPYSAFSAAAGNSSSSSSSLQAIKSPSNYHIPYYQLQRFVVEGYMHLSEVLSTSLINQLNNYLLHHLGQVGTLVLGGVQGGNTGKFPGNVSNSEEIRQVIDKVQDILREIIHPFGQANPEDDVIYNQKNASAQIAFRYPQLLDYQTNYKAEDIEWHTDGYRQGHSHPFSLLLGVSLSEVSHDFEGNLCLWPSSHFLLHRCRRGIHGDLDLATLCTLTKSDKKYQQFYHPSQESFLDDLNIRSMEKKDHKHDNSSSRLPCLGKPLQLRTKPGDIVLLHPDLAHGGAPNYSGSIREMLYFRIKIPFGDKHEFTSWDEIVELQGNDIWVDYLGLQERIGKDELKNITASLR